MWFGIAWEWSLDVGSIEGFYDFGIVVVLYFSHGLFELLVDSALKSFAANPNLTYAARSLGQGTKWRGRGRLRVRRGGRGDS